MLARVLAIASLATAAFAASATTTHYHDGTLGACGCGTVFNSASYIYTAAVSPLLFGGTSTWCGTGCGKCFTLTSTGTSPPGQGTGGGAGKSIMVIATNLCPHAGNENWCPVAGQNNAYGYNAHFDIDSGSGNGGWNSLGWNNPIVTYTQVACPSAATSLYRSCQCK